jgi:hypothetical protein
VWRSGQHLVDLVCEFRMRCSSELDRWDQWRLVRGGRVGSAHPKPNDIFFLNLCILIFKFTNYLIDDLLLESKCFYRYIKTFPRRIFVRVDMSSLRGVR